MFRIGPLTLNNWLLMAPMAGYTTLAFRLMVKKLGAGCVTTEMVSAMGLVSGHAKTSDYLKSHPDERPLSVQIFGSSPEVMARAAEIAEEAGADLVDINMGCPVKKVVKTGAGAALLRDMKKAAHIVSAVRRACSVPLTVKIRLGWSPEEPVAPGIARLVEDCGADAITIHPRYATQGFSTPADWTWIGRIKERLKIPVIGNGDILEPIRALCMRKETGCDGVMIGRGAIANPWIFKQIGNIAQGLPQMRPSFLERRAFIIGHFRLLCESMEERKAALAMRGVLLFSTRGLPFSSQFRESIARIRDMESLVSAMENYFSRLEKAES
jgi:nifR3 family TIM-barrel protein